MLKSGMLWRILISSLLSFGCSAVSVYSESRSAVPADDSRTEFPALLEYEQHVKAALKLNPPVLNLLPASAEGSRAVSLALKSTDFLTYVRDATSKTINRNEIFSVRPIKAGDLSSDDKRCEARACWLVEMYNFTRNFTSYAIVDLDHSQLVSTRHLTPFQADIPEHLRQLAIEIARHSPLVKEQLKSTPAAENFVMAGTKTALNRTRCERSKHVCVSPTFVFGNTALWTIVDLHEGRVVGTRHTTWHDGAKIAYTEQKIQDEAITEALCKGPQKVERDGWKFQYHLTSSDGIEVEHASFQGQPRILSAKNVDWHVSYSDKDGFGYSDAIGCPLFSAAAVVPAKLPKFKELKRDEKLVGFELHQDFISKHWPLPCNYYYEQRFQFFFDGSFRVAVASVGRGCGEPGIYRPVLRIELPVDQPNFSSWDGAAWKRWTHEGFVEQNAKTTYSAEGYQFKIQGADGSGFYIAPGRGQFADKGRGDNAFTYVVREHPDQDEGKRDLPTIGPCCNADYHQGPDKFINSPPEALGSNRLVLWYVPQLINDGRPGQEYCWGSADIVDGQVVKYEYPCIAGPLFVPIAK